MVPPIFLTPFLTDSHRLLCFAVKALKVLKLLGPDHLLRHQDAIGTAFEGCWEEAKPQQTQEAGFGAEWQYLHAPFPFPFKGLFMPKH